LAQIANCIVKTYSHVVVVDLSPITKLADVFCDGGLLQLDSADNNAVTLLSNESTWGNEM